MSTEAADTPAMTFAERVNEVVTKSTIGEDGNLQLPEGLEVDEATTYAATLEKRRRDTQSAYSKGQTEIAALRAENETLAGSLQEYTANQLTEEQTNELDELKATDPDAWRTKINELEAGNRTKFQETRETITKEARGTAELTRREALLEEFNEANPEIQLTDDLLANDIPPRITKQLAEGEATFEEFLANVKDYLSKGKVIATGEEPPKSPNLSNAAGGSKPSPGSVESEISNSYKEEVF